MRSAFLFLLLALFSFPSFAGAETAWEEKIFYDDARSWPFQPERLGMRRGRFYIALPKEGKIAVVDPQSRSVVKYIPVAPGPNQISVVPGMRYLYVTHQEGERLTVIDTKDALVIKGVPEGAPPQLALIDTSDQVIRELETGTERPFRIAFSPVEPLALVGNHDPEQGHVTYIDTARHEVVGAVKTNGKKTQDLLFTHDGAFAFLGNRIGPLDLLDVKQGKIINSLRVEDVGELRMSPDGEWLLANSAQGYVALISVADLSVTRIEIGPERRDLLFSRDSRKAYVGGGKSLVVIDVEKKAVQNKIAAGFHPLPTYLFPDRNLAIAMSGSRRQQIGILDLVEGRLIKKIQAGRTDHQIQFSADAKFGLISNSEDPFVTLIDGKKLEKLADIHIGSGSGSVKWVPYESSF